jgi:hypothetical protein
VLIPSSQVFFAFRLYVVSQNIWVAIPAWTLSFMRFVFLVWWQHASVRLHQLTADFRR